MTNKRRTIDVDMFHGKITANEATLSYISLLASEAATRYEDMNSPALAKQAKKFADKIYDYLNEKGYYDAE